MTFEKKGDMEITTIPLTPLRDLVEIKGTYDEIMSKSFYEGTTYKEDYMHITLTDEEKKEKLLEWVSVHGHWLFSIAGMISVMRENLEKSALWLK